MGTIYWSVRRSPSLPLLGTVSPRIPSYPSNDIHRRSSSIATNLLHSRPQHDSTISLRTPCTALVFPRASRTRHYSSCNVSRCASPPPRVRRATGSSFPPLCSRAKSSATIRTQTSPGALSLKECSICVRSIRCSARCVRTSNGNSMSTSMYCKTCLLPL